MLKEQEIRQRYHDCIQFSVSGIPLKSIDSAFLNAQIITLAMILGLTKTQMLEDIKNSYNKQSKMTTNFIELFNEWEKT